MAMFGDLEYEDPRELEESERGYHDDGRPTLITLGNALQCWSVCQARAETTFGEAALAFDITPERVAEAVTFHPWLFTLDDDREPADRRIEHEGE